MKGLILVITILCYSAISFGQSGELVENKAIKFSIEQASDTIDFVVVDTLLKERKPIFLWCQGSLPIPLFFELGNYGTIFFGGGVSNFNYSEIVDQYHLVVISMPKTPLLVTKKNLNKGSQYIPNPNEPNKFSTEYIKADYLENYVNRAEAVLGFLKEQSWVNNEKLVVAGHSQGTKVATKIASRNKDVTVLGLLGANPFGRIDQMIRQARLDAQLGKITWEEADSTMNRFYKLYEDANNQDSLKQNPSLKAWKTFSETYYDDWLELDIPIYLAYGTEDRVADLCDLVPLFFIEKKKTNLTLKRYIGLEHNFFEVDENGRAIQEKNHWEKVIEEFLNWIE